MQNYPREATYGSISKVTHGSLCTFVSSFIDSSLHLAYIRDNTMRLRELGFQID
jgi:hypothetical protein